jgi:hypothetical protein
LGTGRNQPLDNLYSVAAGKAAELKWQNPAFVPPMLDQTGVHGVRGQGSLVRNAPRLEAF